jgi:protein SERAC1
LSQTPFTNFVTKDKRKIIFIVHGLGGLLLKKALCLSNGSSHEYLKELDHCTIGIIFLGTPHRGSDVASLPQVAFNVLKAFGKQGNKDLLELFDRNSTELENISRDFAEWVNKNRSHFNMMCFYEELGVKGIGKVRWYPYLCSIRLWQLY